MSATFDTLLNTLRDGLTPAEVSKLAAVFEPKMVYTTLDNSGSTVSIAFVNGGTHVTVLNPVDSITITGPTANTDRDCEVVFTAGTATPVVDIPVSMSVVGSPSYAAGKSYIINILDNMLVSAEYTPGV